MVLRRNKLILPGLDVLEARQLFSIAYTATLIQPASALPTADNPQGAVAVSGGYVAGNLIYGSTLRSYALQGPGSSPVILQPLQGDSKTIAHSVNTTGLVAGVSYSGGDDGDTDSSDDPHAVLWNGVTGRASSLGGGVATSINSAGLVVGQYHDQAVLFVHSTPRSIGDLGGDTSAAEGINDRNVIVGESDTADGQQSIPYIYDGRRSYAIVPSGLTGSDISGTGNAINSAGEAVGTIGAGAFVYQNGSASLLPLPIENTAITASAANDVNDSGEIVGSVTTAAGSTAVIWPGDGSVIDLNALQSDPTVKLFSAVAIDSDGEVLAYGQQGSTVGTFLLTPQRSHVSPTGTLVITGTEGDDQISITLKSNKYRVSVNDLVVNYAATHVKRISISAGGGDDTITLASNISRSASVDGGDGDDTISGGGGADYLLGNDGNDLLIGNSGRDTLDGGDGTDTAISEKGDTLINIEPQMQAAHR